MATTNKKTGAPKRAPSPKKEIQKITGWSDKEYKSKYNQFRNQLRNYESVTGITTKSASSLFSKKIKNEVIGEKLTKSTERILKGVELAPSGSTSKKLTTQTKTRSTKTKELIRIEEQRQESFGALLETSHFAHDLLIDDINKAINSVKAKDRARLSVLKNKLQEIQNKPVRLRTAGDSSAVQDIYRELQQMGIEKTTYNGFLRKVGQNINEAKKKYDEARKAKSGGGYATANKAFSEKSWNSF